MQSILKKSVFLLGAMICLAHCQKEAPPKAPPSYRDANLSKFDDSLTKRAQSSDFGAPDVSAVSKLGLSSEQNCGIFVPLVTDNGTMPSAKVVKEFALDDSALSGTCTLVVGTQVQLLGYKTCGTGATSVRIIRVTAAAQSVSTGCTLPAGASYAEGYGREENFDYTGLNRDGANANTGDQGVDGSAGGRSVSGGQVAGADASNSGPAPTAEGSHGELSPSGWKKGVETDGQVITSPKLTEGCLSSGQRMLTDQKVDVSHGKDRYREQGIDDAKSANNEGCWTNFTGLSGFFAKRTLNNECAIPGNNFRRGGITEDGRPLAMVVEGGAAKWKITTKLNNNTIDEKELDEKEFWSEKDKQYVIPFHKFLKTNSAYGGAGEKGSIKIVGLDASGNQVGKECNHSFRVVSPIVLDLSGLGIVADVHVAESHVNFDLDGSGHAVRTGWIQPSMGFLALDRNHNGRIDNGTELFGDATPMTKALRGPQNGYTALAQFDGNSDGKIDGRDPVFGELRVWIDENQDGQSQPGEVRTLASLGISSISTKFEAVPAGLPQAAGKGMLANDARWMSRFYGPKQCGKEGCRSFDLYFQTLSTSVSQQK